jgi:dTDP-4-dehydrorhamnose 3,5-epimerase
VSKDFGGLKVIPTSLPGVLILEPQVFADDRGFFLESYNQRNLEAAGIDAQFVQDNHSHSRRNVLRGLHYQVNCTQAKLVRVVVGEIFDVAVDLRRSSASFGKWFGLVLSAENKRMLWMPSGFAHGFHVHSEVADVLYKSTDFYAPELERTIAWDDPDLAISWNLSEQPIVSEKDRDGVQFKGAEVFA